MAFILESVINLKPEEVHHLNIPYVCDTHDVERLRRIIYMGLHYLRARQEKEILAGWEDAINLYNWFFETQKQNIRQEIETQFQAEEMSLSPYVDVERYVENTSEAFELSYLGEVDVLNAILNLPHLNSLAELSCVTSNFSPTEFFSVLALYQAAIAIKELTNTRKMLDDSEEITLAILQGLKDASNATLEAQVAIDYAERYNEVSTQLNDIIQNWITTRRQWLVKKAHAKRYGDKHKKRHEKAWELYQRVRPKHVSDNNAIAEIVEEIQAYSDELGIARLGHGNEIDTIYRWILPMKPKKQKK